MEQAKRIILCCMAVIVLIFGCSAIAGGTIKIKQAYTPSPPSTKTTNLKATANYGCCGIGTHIQVINRSDYLVYVRVPASGNPYDFPLYPAYQGNNIDYIDSDAYYNSLRIIVLASDDYTILYDGYVPNCQNLYVDNPNYMNNMLGANKVDSKSEIAKLLKISIH